MKRQTLFQRRMNFVMALILPILILSTMLSHPLKIYGDSENAVVTRGKRIPYPKEIGGGWSTFYYYLDGNLVYCLEPPKDSPKNGTVVETNPLLGNESLEKVLYYGYGGPEDCTDIFMGWADDDLRYLFTHIAASFAYCGFDGLKGCNQELLEEAGVWAYIEYIENLPAVPDTQLSFTSSEIESHMEDTIQRTGEITLQGDARNEIQIPLSPDITLHNDTQKTEITGKTATVHGGDTFYFSAPLIDLEDYESGELYGSLDKSWRSIITKTEGSYQVLGGIKPYKEKSVPVKLRIKWARIPFEAYLRIRKVDKNTQKPVLLAGASFKIRNLDTKEDMILDYQGQKISEFTTDDTGVITTPLKLSEGKYEVREVHAPAGYLLSDEKAVFTVEKSDSLSGDDQNAVIDVVMTDEQQKGRIEIQKHGQKLHGYEDDFLYNDDVLEGVKFSVSAAEDIYTPDHQTDENGNRILDSYQGTELRKGAKLIEITTDLAGIASLYDIPLGRYEIREIETQDGFLISDEPFILEVPVEAETENECVVSYDCENIRQRTRLSLTKTDEGTNKPLMGVVYGVYANQDFFAADQVVVSKDTLLQEKTTDQDGNLTFDLDLPPGLYYVKELKAPEGYIRDETKYEVDLTGKEDAEKKNPEIIEKHLELTNKKEVPPAPPTPTPPTPQEEIPQLPKKEAKKLVQSTPVKTGDESEISEAAAITAASGLLVTVLLVLKKKRIKTHSKCK